LAALDWAAAQGADAVVSASVDTPFLPGDLVPQLWLAGDGGLTVAECGGRLHPTCALWPVSLRDDLRGWLASGEAKVMGFAARHGAARAGFSDPTGFMNLNTPEDIAAAEAALRA
ncbi:molybdenum cofactor guanylyltransferase MobA, partial [Cereibacter changlensis]